MTPLRRQWAKERRAVGKHLRPFGEYAIFVALNPWIFGSEGKRSLRPLIEEARFLALEQLPIPPSRWKDEGKTTPSGKVLFRCSGCSAESPLASSCRGKCSDMSEAHPGWKSWR